MPISYLNELLVPSSVLIMSSNVLVAMAMATNYHYSPVHGKIKASTGLVKMFGL